MRLAHEYVSDISYCNFSALHGTTEVLIEPETGDELLRTYWEVGYLCCRHEHLSD